MKWPKNDTAEMHELLLFLPSSMLAACFVQDLCAFKITAAFNIAYNMGNKLTKLFLHKNTPKKSGQ